MNQLALVQALFLLISMSLAGIVHVLWLRSRLSKQLAWPVDGGLHFRQRRLLGNNKRFCGFLALPPAAAAAFVVLAGMFDLTSGGSVPRPWALTLSEYAVLGMFCGFAFMLAELPNSFLKRQLDIAPGEAPTNLGLRILTFLIDRYDSIMGALIALSLIVPVSLATWVWVLLLGPVVHALFSIAMFALGLKARAL
jgi:hypothetical protein